MRLKRLFCFWFVCCHFNFITNLFSQDLQPNWVSGQREKLPDWVYSPLEKGFVIAASDPCMTLDDGRKQAIHRALWLFSLQSQIRVQMLSDVFSAVESSVDRNSNKILSLIMMSNKDNSYTYEIMNEHHTLFGEVVVRVRFFENDDELNLKIMGPSSISSQSEWMVLYSDDKFAKKEYRIVINMQVDGGFIDSFEIKGSWEHPAITSFFEGKRVFITQKGCWYEETLLDTVDVTSGNDLEYAFWAACVTGLANQLFSYSFIKSNIQSVLDNYQGGVMYDLSRERAIGDISIVPEIHGIKHNKLFVNWEISNATGYYGE